MTPRDQLKDIESKIRSMSLYTSPTALANDLLDDCDWLIERVKQLTETLESIACRESPDMDKDEYWLNKSHAQCAESLALDTSLARIVLKEAHND